MGGLVKIDCEGQIQLQKIDMHTSFFLNLARFYSCIILTVLSYVCINI